MTTADGWQERRASYVMQFEKANEIGCFLFSTVCLFGGYDCYFLYKRDVLLVLNTRVAGSRPESGTFVDTAYLNLAETVSRRGC